MNFQLLMSVANAEVLVEFDWYGTYEDGEPEWDTMKVLCLLPCAHTPEGMKWVKVNDILSDDQWNTIERTIYENEDELRRQAIEQEY